MISVQNHQQPLNGNKLLFALGLSVLVFLGACSPKTRVLKSPDYSKGNVGGTTPKTENSTVSDKVEEVEAEKRTNEAMKNSIALILPFQLDKLVPDNLSEEDIKRSAIALDFYQGFQSGLDELAKKGNSFSLRVIDSRNNVLYNQKLAASVDIKNTALVVGPVFPKEIHAFGTSLLGTNQLQINPLAASRPQEFNQPNLVSLTPSIDAHRQAMIERVVADYQIGDKVLIYATQDDNSKQFLTGFETGLKQLDPSISVNTVTSIQELNEQLNLTGRNLIVAGTTDRFQLRSFLSNLETKSLEELCSFNLYGHPLWERIDFTMFERFSTFHPIITAESHLSEMANDTKAFKDHYYEAYRVKPSDYAFKGYDAGLYFGGLIAKYGTAYSEHLEEDEFNGLYSKYIFEHNARSGYLNNAVSFKAYKGSAFQLN